MQAITLQNLNYHELKEMVRASLEHSFLPGASLWKATNHYHLVTEACAEDTLGGSRPSNTCAQLLTKSQRAAMQWKLEAQLSAFEDTVAQPFLEPVTD